MATNKGIIMSAEKRFTKERLISNVLFVSLLLLCLWSRIDTAIALAAGIVFSLIFTNHFAKIASKLSKILLQISVVGLGFGIGISQVIKEGKHSIVYTIIGISLTLLIGKWPISNM